MNPVIPRVVLPALLVLTALACDSTGPIDTDPPAETDTPQDTDTNTGDVDTCAFVIFRRLA